MAELRIGLIGLDTSHVSAFSNLLNNPGAPHHVGGGRVAVAFPGVASQDLALSRDRVKGYTDELASKHGVKIVDSAEAVAEQADLVFIESVDGRVHRKIFEQIARFRKPTFIDKPMATSAADAEAMFRLADQHGVPLMSSSSLRYAQNLADALAGRRDDIVGCDIFGPMSEEPAMPGLYWYGIHVVEMLVAIMGTGCVELQAFRNDGGDLVRLTYGDGRLASIRGLRNAHHHFGVTLHRKENFQFVDASGNAKPYYASLLEAILRSLPKGKSDVPREETLEVIHIIDAANRSRKDGSIVRLG